MRKWFWCGTLLLIGGAVACYWGASHGARHPESFLGRFLGKSHVAARTSPLVSIGAILPEGVLPLPAEVRQAQAEASGPYVVEPIVVDLLPLATRILTEEEPPILAAVPVQAGESPFADGPSPLQGAIPLMPVCPDEEDEVALLMTYAEDEEPAADCCCLEHWLKAGRVCQVVERSLGCQGVVAGITTGLSLFVEGVTYYLAQSRTVRSNGLEVEVEINLPQAQEEPAAEPMLQEQPFDYHQLHPHCPGGGCPYPHYRYQSPAMQRPTPPPARDSDTPARPESSVRAGRILFRSLNVVWPGMIGSFPRVDTMECRPDDCRERMDPDQVF